MGDKFPGSGRELGKQGTNHVSVEDSRACDSDGAVGGRESVLSEEALEVGAEATEGEDFCGTQPTGARRSTNGPFRLKGIADAMNPCFFCSAKNGAKDGWEHVGVLVRVEVREAQTAVLEAGYLRGGFGFDFFGADAAGEEALEQSGEGRRETLSLRVDKGGNLIRRQDWFAVDEDDVASDAEGWVGEREGDGLVSCSGVGH